MPLRPPSSLDALKPVFGWWGLDPEGPTLVNKASCQRIRYVRTVRPDFGSLLKPWHRFEYEDDEVRYPVLARVVPRGPDEWISRDERTACMARMDPAIRDAPILRIDHNLSADLWRAENNSPSKDPPYGLWCRIDDCITDAFPCCFNYPPTGEPISAVMIHGGWLNSRWHAGFRRSFPVPEEHDRQRWGSRLPVVSDYPFIMPVTEPLPSPWRFHGLPKDAEEKNSERWYVADLKGIVSVANPGGVQPQYILPAEAPLAGFHGKTPYLLSEDQTRVLFPTSVTSRTASHTASVFTVQYADTDLTAIVVAENKTTDRTTDWSFFLRTCIGEKRDLRSPDEYWIYLQNKTPFADPIPTIALWRRVSWAITDSWLSWKGTAATSCHWASGLALSAARSLSIEHMYLGGHWLLHPYFTGIKDRMERE